MFKVQFWIVARQTFKTRLKTRAFWLVVLSPLLMLAMVAGVAWLVNATNSDKTPRLAVVDAPQVTAFLKNEKTVKAKLSNVATVSEAKTQVNHDKIDNYLLFDQATDQFTLKSVNGASPVDSQTLQAALNQYGILSRAEQLNLKQSDLVKLLAPTNLKTEVVSLHGKTTDGSATRTANRVMSSALGIGIFIFLTFYGGMISNEIANEKSSRIMEILLAATSPAVQFFGKIAGIAGLAILHLLIYTVVGVGVVFALPNNAQVRQVTSVLSGVDSSFMIVTGLLVFVGILLYMVLTAVVAAMVNDQSQVQQAVAPISYLAMVGYILSLLVAVQPNNLMIKILSFVPFVSQTLMPARMSVQYATVAEGLIALALELVVLVYIGWVGLGVYKKNVLQYNDGNLTRAVLLSIRDLFVKTRN